MKERSRLKRAFLKEEGKILFPLEILLQPFSPFLLLQRREPPADLQPNHRGDELPGGPARRAQGSRGAVSKSLTCGLRRGTGREDTL